MHSLINGDKKLASRPLVIGKTPNIFSVCDKSINVDDDLVITKKVIEKCMRPEMRDENGMRLKDSGHYLSEEQLAKALESLKEPVMVLKGSLNNTFVAVTDFKDDKDKEIIVSIGYNKVGSVSNVNVVSSAYGREDFPQYIIDNLKANNIIAINIEKANKMLLSIGVDFPEAITFISFDNSIAYSTANVKYISEIFQNFSEKEKPSNEEIERNDNMAEISQQELLDRIVALEKQVKEMSDEQQLKAQIATVNPSAYEKNVEKENYSIFFIENGGERAYFRDDNTDVNVFLQRLADCNESYPDFLKGCTKISGEEFAGLEQSEKTPPIFCAEINLDTTDPIGFEKPKELTIWDNDKIATINLDEAIQSIKENGTVNLDYQKFAENNDTVELTSDYLDSLEQLNNAYDDFSYHNSIFNNEHIAFVDNHGQLPYDLNTAENRALVSEYINIQLDSGNINDVQRDRLKTLQQAIREFEEPLFTQKVEEIAQWANEVIDKSKGRDEPDRNDPAR